ncbi:universal stress protein [Actinoplanes sp. CA-030573]|uniref:universal stress protein n=1 Tax=Actinoplanes sp. CA-030573 TaxID=3239898 RepID=UPI003D8C62D5
MGEDTERKVVVGVSQSLAGLAALRFALDLAHRRSVPLWAVRVWRLEVGPRAQPSAEWERAIAAEARRYVDDCFRAATGHAVRDLGVIVRTPSGRTDVALHHYLTDGGDLLVVGAAARRWWSGGTVRRCVRGAGCPVIVVPAPDLARTGRFSARRIAREAAAELSRTGPTRGRP